MYIYIYVKLTLIKSAFDKYNKRTKKQDREKYYQ